MSVAKVIEITSTSREGFEDAIRNGLRRANDTIKHVEGAWIKEQKVKMQDGAVQEFRVNMLVTFRLDGG